MARITARVADEAVGVVQTLGLSGGQESGHDAAFGDDEGCEFGKEMGRVCVCC